MSRWMRFLKPLSTLGQWRPQRMLNGPIVVALGMFLVGGVAFGLGRWIGLGAAAAQTPMPDIRKTSGAIENAHLYDSDYTGRVVAYIHGNIPIYRVDLAEYLIARFGAERLERLVNRKIVEKACQAKGIHVTDLEIEHEFRRSISAFGPHVTAKLFEDQILKPRNMTTFDFKEDVLRINIGLAKLVGADVVVTDDDLLKAFEMKYGPKVQCRMIIYKDSATARKKWQQLRDSANLTDAFLAEAKTQFVGDLAAVGGEVPPIHKHFGDPRIEKEAFGLKPGEMSQAFGMSDNTAIILLCEKHLPTDQNKVFERERLALINEVKEQKRIRMFDEMKRQLRKDAAPRFLLARQPQIDQVQREALEELGKDRNFRGVDTK